MATKSFYPHMVVSDIQKVSTNTVENFLVKYTLADSTLLTDLKTVATNGDPLSTYKTIAQTYLDNDADALNTKEDLIALFPRFDFIVEMLATDDPATLTPFDPSDFDIITNESRLWDNALAHYIVSQTTSLSGDLILAVRLVALLKKVDGGDLTTNEEILEFWKRSVVVFPKPPFPLPKPEAVLPPQPPQPAPGVTYEDLLAELKELEKAREDVVNVYGFQIESIKKDKTAEQVFKDTAQLAVDEDQEKGENTDNTLPIDLDVLFQAHLNEVFPDELNATFEAKLKEDTLDQFKKLDITAPYNVKFVTNKIDARIRRVSVALTEFAQLENEHVVAIGGTLIAVNNAVYEDIICTPEKTITHCELLHQLAAENPDKTYVQVLGMGNAHIIRQELLRYEADEIAHIENVLQGENRSKTHRNLKRREEITFTETERNEETETDTKTTDRFELSKEVSEIASQATQFTAGVTVSGGYGPVNFSASVGYANSSSSTQAAATAVNNAKEITERAVHRIQERSLERREIKTLNEVEVTNEHGIDNASGTDHINGFYYWVDKVYQNQVYNVGKRLMLEFLIPEPAAYHIYCQAFTKQEGVTVVKPVPPNEFTGRGITESLKSHKGITRTNYHLWADIYGVQDLNAPPTEYQTIANSYSLDYTPGGKLWHDKNFNDLAIPEGYEADTGRVNIGLSGGSGRYLAGHLGNKRFATYYTTTTPINLALDQETGVVPLSFRGHFSEYHMNVEVICKLSEIGFEKWQIATYNSILNAYNQKKSEYDSQVRSLETAVVIRGQNPAQNRKVEQTELKKWALELLTLQRFDGFNAMRRATGGQPEIDFEEALNEGTFVKFFEQAMEWHNMTYLFYPYFWAHKERWTTVKQFNDADPVFTQFLKAGYARVVVPVHPLFTEAMLHYLNTGEIWLGEALPAIDDELYLSIIEEIQQAQENTDGEAVGDPWETRIPTNMVMITSEIPDNLPGS